MQSRNDLILAYFRLLIRIKRHTKPDPKQLGVVCSLTLPQIETLASLAEHGEASVREMATRMRVSPSAVTQLSDGLVRMGLLRRSHREDDRRVVILHLTPKAKRTLSTMQESMLASLKHLTAPLSTQELQSLIDLHAKMNHAS